MKIGVLALQGAFLEHEQMLQKLDIDTLEIRQLSDFQQSLDGVVIPGGESTVQLKLLHDLQLFSPLREAIVGGLPVFGTCAGLILLAREVVGESQPRLSTMDMVVRRNAYGRQLGSFYTEQAFQGVDHAVPMTFIRAPYIESVGDGVEVLAETGGHIVAARQGNQMVTAFHPELDDDMSIHAMFVAGISGK